jgi:hypothetical protein
MPPRALKLGYWALMTGKVSVGGRTLPVRPCLGLAEAEEWRHRRLTGRMRHPQPFSG